ncbi:MAG: Orn/Lys/Arg decarboxylase N-terminal domain-containing protein [Candidatus Sulfotelmatobacter sp.]
MIERRTKRIHFKVLIIDDNLGQSNAGGRALRALIGELAAWEIEVVEATSADDGMSVIVSDAALHCILLDWDLGHEKSKTHSKALSLVKLVRGRDEKVPIFLMAERQEAPEISVEAMQMTDEFVWKLEDTAEFIGGRIRAAMERYRDNLLPPMTAALAKFRFVHEYSWHTPGHAGGTAFLKSPVGRVFYDYFGENLLRSDLSISVGELGSLLDHTGPIGESEKYAARVFGSHRTYCVTNGSSTSNRILFMAAVSEGQVALCDRNCHKSIEHGLTMTGAIPNYLVPMRNRYGIIGPIHPDRLTPRALSSAIASNPLVDAPSEKKPVYCVITNSTYDGLCYNVKRVTELLDPTVDRIHFDEAWYAYARFNPIYRERFGMHGNPADHKGPTIFTTHSTHKLLAALSQASFLHVRDGRNPIDHARFNESFMMHSSTSPFYPIIASNDVTAAMMDGPGGIALTTESIQEAVAFRQMIGRIRRDFVAKGDWFFETWNAHEIVDPKSSKRIPFESVPAQLLVTDPACWVLHPGDSWHGFEDLEDGYCMLDPIKVSVVTPGVALDGSLKEPGIPASLVTSYLARRGIQVEKTTDFTILFLFSIGITKGKWGTLVNAFLEFKRDYDLNTPLAQVLPDLVRANPRRYANLGLRDLANEMFAQLQESRQTRWLAEAFSSLPKPLMTPRQAYRQLVLNEVEKVALDRLANRVVATSVVPYPPGIPMLMPGESAGTPDGPYLSYLRALQSWDERFPGFGHDTHGVENIEGTYYVYCLKEAKRRTGISDEALELMTNDEYTPVGAR